MCCASLFGIVHVCILIIKTNIISLANDIFIIYFIKKSKKNNKICYSYDIILKEY